MTTTHAPVTQGRSPVRRLESDDSEHVLALSALVVPPLAFAVTLFLALPAGIANAAIIALVPAVFSSAFFGGLYWLAGALKRDERLVLPATVTTPHPAPGSRAA